jgi:hypothetical protein
MINLISAEYISNYELKLQFSDGSSGVVDFHYLLNEGVFSELREVELFKDFFIDQKTKVLMWRSGQDVATEYLYYKAFEDKKENYPLYRKWGYL